jgi:hypothetical protein
MALNNPIKFLEIRFFGVIFTNTFMASTLGKLAPPFQQRFRPELCILHPAALKSCLVFTRNEEKVRVPHSHLMSFFFR